jgi:SNF2 family DNA or RNA helicase
MNPSSNPSSEVRIDYDPKTSRFVIHTPAWMVDKVRKIPNRRWDSKRRVWTAPALRANSDFLITNFSDSAFTGIAREVANQTIERVSQSVVPFPVLYPFKTEPRKYQRTALDRAWGKETFAYYMDMGTGKTKTSLDLMSAYYIDGKVERVLVVTKFSTRRNWEAEIRIHCPVQCDVHVLDTSKAKAFDEWNARTDQGLKFLIVGTESLAAGHAIKYASTFVNSALAVAMIVDEAHMIKTHNAVRSKNCVDLGRSARYKVIMTGTPIANGPMDVFMQFEFLDPNIIGIGDFYSFRNRYAIMGGYEDRQVVGYQNMEELIELISPFVYQVRKSEVLTELPPKIYETREVQLNDEQKRLYKEISKRDRAVSGDRGITVNSVLERMLRLQEIAGGIITYERNPDLYNPEKFEHTRIPGKNPKVDELIAITEENECSTIVWCRFIEEIQMVSEALVAKYGPSSVVQIYGAIDEDTRWDNVSEKFQKGVARFIVGNAATGGVGLNMTAAELVIYYSNSFSFTDREQSEDRAHRIGQTKSVTYIDIVAEGTVDGVVVEALRGKKDVSEFVRTSIASRNEGVLMGALG